MSKIFEWAHTVTQDEIDEFDHVNNEVYLKWFNNTALRHLNAHGWTIEAFIQRGAGWIIRRHEIDYLIPIQHHESVTIRTWVETIKHSSSVRQYEIRRNTDEKLLARACTVWVWINYKNGRPEEIPKEFYTLFGIS